MCVATAWVPGGREVTSGEECVSVDDVTSCRAKLFTLVSLKTPVGESLVHAKCQRTYRFTRPRA